MIIVIVARRDAPDALDYGARVGAWAKPEGPAPEIGGSLPEGEPLERWCEEFERCRLLRPEVKKDVVHIIISLSDEDRKLPPEELLEIAKTALERLGYGDGPYRITEHLDGHVQHLHAICSGITYAGERVTRDGDRRKSMKIRQELELAHGLWRAPMREGDPVLSPSPDPERFPRWPL